ncbi:MAG: binding-protein-dependent transport system inner rane component [Acidimicrobiaceae bacterium]|nr:binding-protein-dependent transport system inner rane component [Acidimicrobiaceae bacterium]
MSDSPPGAGAAVEPMALRAWRASRAGSWLPTLVALAVVAGVWQLVALHNPSVLPTVPQVFREIADHPGLFARDTGATLRETAVGALVAGDGAFLLAVAMSELPLVERAIMPLAVALNVTPVVAIAPALTLILGFGAAPRYVVTGIVVFFPFLINCLVGLRSVDPEVLEVARSLNASRAEVLWRLRIPSSLPLLFAAARICLPLAVVGAVVAEFSTSGSSSGLGSQIVIAEQYAELPTIFASILLLAAIGIALTLATFALERWLLGWHRAARGLGVR